MPLNLDFQITDKNKWEELIAKALKINSLDEFEYKKVAGVDIPPFNHPAANIESFNPLSSVHQNWKIGLSVDSNGENAASDIINAVQNGAEAIILAGDKINWSELYNGVFHEMIYTDIESATNPNTLQEFIDYSQAQGKDLSKLTGSIAISEEALKANVDAARNLSSFHFFTGVSSSENIPDALYEISQQLQTAIEQIAESNLPLSCIRASLTVDAHLPVNISKLRALRVIWANLLQAYGHKFQPLFIKVKTKVSAAANKETALIENTSACINAALGTADMICSFHNDEQNTARLNQNIQHIMKMESNVHSVSDPLAGSYAIEKMTNQLATDCWTKLSKV